MSKFPEWANWLARDENGDLYAYEIKPYKSLDTDEWLGSRGDLDHIKEIEFDNIHWSDEEPTGIKSLIIQLDEPEKVVIPQYVADWWERVDDSVTLYGGLSVGKKSKLYLISKFYDMGLGDYFPKVEEWIDENNSIFLDLVNGKPYEIEKEKLYFVSFPKPNGGYINMWRNTDTGSYYFAKSSSITSQDGYRCVFTEKEIKEHDERFWQFAQNIKEEEK